MLKREHWHLTYRWAKRIAISIVGGTVLLIGVAMIVLPGPALVVIPLGLAVLGVEFAWARRWLRKVKARTADLVAFVRNNGRTNSRKVAGEGAASGDGKPPPGDGPAAT